MIEGVGLPPAPASAPPVGASAAPPAGAFLQLLAGGFAAPAPMADLLEAPAVEGESDAGPVVEDPAGFLSAWFGLTPLPVAANDAAPRGARQFPSALPVAGATSAVASTMRAGLPASPDIAGSADVAAQAQALVVDAPALMTMLESGGVAVAVTGGTLDLNAVMVDTVLETVGTPVQDPGATLGARSVERLAPTATPQPLNVDIDFEAALDAQLRWQVETGLSEAVIDLNPAELGALTIRIQLQGDQTSLQIHAAEAATRQLLQQLLPQMGERLAQSGLFYAGGEVHDRGGGDAEEGSSPTSAEASGGAEGRRRISVYLVDAYV